MNFDDRLGYITPFALNEDISKFRESDLWRRYKNARELRNDVTHKGIEVSFEKAEEVYKTMYDWLACLESSVGLELSLYGFRQIIEGSEITSLNDYFTLLDEFYRKSKAGFNLKSLTQIKYSIETAFEWGLKFGQIVVSLDTKFSSGTIDKFNFLVETLIGQTRVKLNNPNIDKAAIIIFHKGELPESFKVVRNFEDGKIYIIAIKVELVHTWN